MNNDRGRFGPRLIRVVALVVLSAVGGLRAGTAPAPRQWDQLMLDSVHALKSNQLDRSIELCQQALQLAATFGPADTHYARSQVLRAEIWMWQKQNAEAEQWFKAAVVSCEKAVGPRNPEMVHPLSSLANYYYFVAHRPDKVAALFSRILTIVDQAPQRDDHQVIVWSRNLGLIHQEMHDYARAEPLFSAAVALAEKTDPAWVPHELLTEAECDRAWGHFTQAERLARRALARREQALAAAPTDVDAKLDLVVSLDALSSILVSAGHASAAEAASRRSLQLAESFMQPDQAELTPRLAGLAAALAHGGKLAEAASLYERAIAIAEKNLGPNDPQLAGLLTDSAALQRRLNRVTAAAALDDRATAIRRHTVALP